MKKSCGECKHSEQLPFKYPCNSCGNNYEKFEPMFKKGERVLVRTANSTKWHRRYYSHFYGGVHFCFYGGADEWESNGQLHNWKHCKKLIMDKPKIQDTMEITDIVFEDGEEGYY